MSRTPRTGVSAQTAVIRGKWVVKCPFCGTCEKRDHGEWHVCRACFNAENEYLRVRVAWPRERAQIERLLGNRCASWVRNWTSEESVADLYAENLKFGQAVD